MSVIYGIVVGLFIAGLVYYFVRKSQQANVGTNQTEGRNEVNVPEVDTSQQELNEKLSSLTELRLKVVLANVPEEVIKAFDEVIDKLFELLPILKGEHKGNQLTWVVERMAGEYIHDLINPYTKLSAEGQSQEKDTLVNTLIGLKSELEKIAELVESGKISDFQTQATFIRHKFFGETVEASEIQEKQEQGGI